MITLIVRHTVVDYTAWRTCYDGFDAARKPMGVIADSVYQAVESPNDVIVTQDLETLDAARAFVSSAELKDTMERAGVVGEPALWFTTKV
jgi:hypothetical protein